jgi:hypothetical protein
VLHPGGLALALEVRVAATAAVPLGEEDPAQVRELDGEGDAERWQKVGVLHSTSIGAIGRTRNGPRGPSLP